MENANKNSEMLAEVLASVNRVEALLSRKAQAENGRDDRLMFDFERTSKHDVMMVLLTMYERGWIAGSKKMLQEFLAEHTNLGSPESVHKLYVRCLRDYVGKGH